MPDQFCFNHPERAALETCEICGKSLCGYCLYYTSDGQRLCEIHAHEAKSNGIKIIPPAIYANGILSSQAEANQQIEPSAPKNKGIYDSRKHAIYQGNNQDLNGFLAMGLGLAGILSCCWVTPCVFPFIAVLLGVLALLNAKDSIEPRRTRQQAWIGIFTGGCMATIILGIIAFYVLLYGSLFAGASFWNFNNVTPYYYSTNTHTPNANFFPTSTPRVTLDFTTQDDLNATATAKAKNTQETFPTSTPIPR